MRLVYRLFELPMVPEGPSAAARPVMTAEFAAPESGWQDAVWVRQKASGNATLCVLWVALPDWQDAELEVAGHQPGDPVYVEVQPGLAVTEAGAEVIFQQGG